MDLLSALEHEDEDGLTMNQLRDCSVLGELAWFEGKPAVNEEWAGPFHPLIASGAYRGGSLAPDGSTTLTKPTKGTCATLAQISRYDPVPGPRLARPELQYDSLLHPVD
jgi:hypothetical protein